MLCAAKCVRKSKVKSEQKSVLADRASGDKLLLPEFSSPAFFKDTDREEGLVKPSVRVQNSWPRKIFLLNGVDSSTEIRAFFKPLF